MENIKRLIKECDEFKKEQLKKPKEEIYENYYKIRFYEEIKQYLEARLIPEDFPEYEIESLIEAIKGKSMKLLYSEFIKNDGSSIETWDGIREFFDGEIPL